MLNPTEYGIYVVGIAVATVTSGVCFQWLNVIVARFLPMQLSSPSGIIDVVANGFWAATSCLVLIYVLTLPLSQAFGVDQLLLGFSLLTVIGLGYHALTLQIVNAQGTPTHYSIIAWSKSGIALVVGFVMISCGFGWVGALLGYFSGILISVIAFAPVPALIPRRSQVDKNLTRRAICYGLPFILTHLGIALVDVSDRLIIASMLGVGQVAAYAAAYDLVQQLVGPLMNVVFLAAFPLIVRDFENEVNHPSRLQLKALGDQVVGLGFPATVGLGVLANDIAAVIFGRDFRQDTAIFIPWLAIAIFVGCFKIYFLDIAFQLSRKTKELGIIAMVMAAINIGLNLLLLPRFGVIAAAWATLAAFSVGAILSWMWGKSSLPLPSLWDVCWTSGCASVAMAAILVSLPESSNALGLIAKGAAGMVSYMVIALCLNIANCRDSLSVWSKFR